MAAEYPLLLDELKAWLGLGNSAQEQAFDGVLMRCLETAEKLVSRHTGRGGGTFLTTSRTEYFSGTFNGELVLTFAPVTAVASVSEVSAASTAGVETSVAIETTRFTVDGYPIGAAFTANDGILMFRGGSTATAGASFLTGGEVVTLPRYYPSPNFGDGRANIKVVYTGGFATEASTPSDLKQAILECACVLAVESPQFSAARERASSIKGRWKELAQPYSRGGGVL